MTDFIPSIAPFSVLAFLGTGFVLGLCVVAGFYAAARKSRRRLARAGSSLALVLVTYTGVLLGFSLFTSEVELPVGAKKYFCETDCHLSYSVVRTWMPANVGEETEQITSQGQLWWWSYTRGLTRPPFRLRGATARSHRMSGWRF